LFHINQQQWITLWMEFLEFPKNIQTCDSGTFPTPMTDGRAVNKNHDRIMKHQREAIFCWCMGRFVRRSPMNQLLISQLQQNHRGCGFEKNLWEKIWN
jgi:hypothetical protein